MVRTILHGILPIMKWPPMIEAFFSIPAYIMIPVVLTGYSITCFGVGILFLKLWGFQFDRGGGFSAGTILSTAFILGQGILASIWLLLALGGRFSLSVIAPLSFIFAIGGLYFGHTILIDFGMQIRAIWRELREDTWGWQLLAALTITLCFSWVTSLGRPLGGDGTAFYMALGKIIAFSQRLVPMPGYDEFSMIGFQGEMHFAALMAFHSPESARLFAWPTVSMAGIMLASLGRVVGMGRRGQWLIVAILFSSSAVILLSGDGKVDLFAVALGLAAYYWAVQVRFTRTKAVLLLTGLLSGFSIVAKLSYIVVMAPTIALLVLWGYEFDFRNKGWWRSALSSFMSGSLVILMGLILAFLPHFIKNGLLFHNPIAPIGSGNVVWLTLNQAWFGSEATRRILLTYPFALTYGSYWGQYGNLSPLVLAFLPLMFYLPRPRPFFSSPMVVVSLTALAGIVVWVIRNPSIFSPRYILATLLLLALLPARSAEYVSLSDQKPRLLAAGVIASALVSLTAAGLFFLGEIFVPSNTVRYLTQTINECDRDGPDCRAMRTINRKAENGSRVYLASYQRYWLRGDLLQCVSSDYDFFPAHVSGLDIWLALYERGFKFLLIDESTHSRMLKQLDFEHLPQWVELQPLNDHGPYVYRIQFNNPPSTVEPAVCQRRYPSRIWEVMFP